MWADKTHHTLVLFCTTKLSICCQVNKQHQNECWKSLCPWNRSTWRCTDIGKHSFDLILTNPCLPTCTWNIVMLLLLWEKMSSQINRQMKKYQFNTCTAPLNEGFGKNPKSVFPGCSKKFSTSGDTKSVNKVLPVMSWHQSITITLLNIAYIYCRFSTVCRTNDWHQTLSCSSLFHIVMYFCCSKFKSINKVYQTKNGLTYIHRDGLGHSFPKLSLFTY